MFGVRAFSLRGRKFRAHSGLYRPRNFEALRPSELQEEAAAAKEALPLSFFLGRFFFILSVYSGTHHLDGINFFSSFF